EIFLTKIIAYSLHEHAKARIRIAGILSQHLFIALDRVAVQRSKIFSDQQVLRLEVTVERHLVGLSCGGDLIDAHAANTPGIEEVTGRIENAFTRGDIRLHARMSCCLQNLPSCHLTRYLLVSNSTDVTNQYHITSSLSRLLNTKQSGGSSNG